MTCGGPDRSRTHILCDRYGILIWQEFIQSSSGVDNPTGGVYFSDNYLLLLPGESRAIAAEWHNVPEPDRRLQLQGWNTSTAVIS
jgi:beta-galactosidase/beta-glucuronidase